MKFAALLTTTALFLSAPARADDDSGVQTVFSGDQKKFNASIEILFKKFDKDMNGAIGNSDVEAFFNLKNDSNSSMEEQKGKIAAFFSAELKRFDTNNDGTVSLEEMNTALLPMQSTEYFLNKTNCDNAAKGLKECKAEFKNSTVPDLQKRVKVFETLCYTGISAVLKYPVEHCIMNATTCDEKIKCYESSTSAPEGTVILTKRDGQLWKTLFWVSVILLGFIAIPSLFLLPFYVILILVGLKIDWNSSTFDEKD